ncbi:MAG: hypothetical protein U0165_15895 [Polyangiaceae bacterium]
MTLVLTGFACEDGPPTAAGLCAKVKQCEQMDLLISQDSCEQQVNAKMGQASDDCAKCVLSLPCSGMTRLSSGKVTLSQLCGTCQDSLARASCPAGHEHMLVCGIARAPSSASGSAAGPPSKAPPAVSASASASASAKAAASAKPATSAK